MFVSDDTSQDSDGHSSTSHKKHKVKLPRPSKSMFFFKKHDDENGSDSRSEHRTSPHPGDGHQLRAARSFNKPEQGIFHKAATSNHFEDSGSMHRINSHSTLPSGDDDEDTLLALAHKAKKSSKNIIGKVFREYQRMTLTID